MRSDGYRRSGCQPSSTETGEPKVAAEPCMASRNATVAIPIVPGERLAPRPRLTSTSCPVGVAIVDIE